MKLSAITVPKVMFGFLLLLTAYQLIMVVLYTSFALSLWGGTGDDDPGNGWAMVLPISAAGLVFIWAELRERTTAPQRSGVLLSVGVLPSILMFWMLIPPIIALVVAVYFVLNGRTQQRNLTSQSG